MQKEKEITMTYRRIARGRSRILFAGVAALIGAALIAAACGGTSSADKTATAKAKGGTTPAAGATTAATKPAGTSTAATSTTPAATGSTTATTGSAAELKITTDPTLGKFFTDSRGFTLYIFKNDVANSGKSAAEGLTAVWPPLEASTAPAKPDGATGDFAIITRVDGKKQVTYKGLPLYYFVNDKAAGDTKGQNVGQVWFVAAP